MAGMATLEPRKPAMKFTYAADARPVEGYTIRRGIHRGGFGEVYYAVSDAGKEVALKLLTHDLDTELRGVRQCLNLKHPNLVTIFDVRTDADGDHWVIMEYIQGASLEDVLAAFPKGLPLEEMRAWFEGLLSGVEYLHERGIVHRDLKPANVYRENGIVKVGDVGLSKLLGSQRHAQHTEAVGTVYYMAPEVARGHYGPEVDVYGLGVILYELLTGRLPFDGETTGEILMKHLSAAPDLSAAPPALRPVLTHALQKDPSKRTPNIRQLRIEFRRALNITDELPASAFLPTSSPTEKSTRDTDHGSKPSRLTPTARSWTLPPVQPVESKRRVHDRRMVGRKPAKEETPRAGWWPWLILAAVLFVPWLKLMREGAAPAWLLLGLATVSSYGLYRWATSSLWVVPPAALPATWGEDLLTTNSWHWSERLSASLLQAAVASVVLMAGGLGVLHWWETRAVRSLSESMMVHLGLLSALGAMACVSWLHLAVSWDRWWLRSRWMLLAVGAGFGLLAGGLDGFLMADYPSLGRGLEPEFHHLGSQTLWQSGQPTPMGYAAFYGVLFGITPWKKLLDPQREQRARLTTIALAAGLGFFTSLFFGMSRPYAMLLAVATISGAQLAAPWRNRNVSPVAVKWS